MLSDEVNREIIETEIAAGHMEIFLIYIISQQQIDKYRYIVYCKWELNSEIALLNHLK